jgi:hypothetical protein
LYVADDGLKKPDVKAFEILVVHVLRFVDDEDDVHLVRAGALIGRDTVRASGDRH